MPFGLGSTVLLVRLLSGPVPETVVISFWFLPNGDRWCLCGEVPVVVIVATAMM